MGYTLYDLDMTDANNTSFANISQAENSMRAPAVNNAFRALDGALARFIADGGGTVTTGGSANAQTVTLNQAIATTVPTGFFFTVKLGYTNTSTTVTLNVNSIGAKSVKVNFGGVLSDPIPGDMRAGAYGHFIYDGTYMVLLNAQEQARYAPGTLYGLTLSNNASDATNDIDIAAGSARDGADSANMDLTTALTKQLDANWAVGTNAGGLDTGSIANATYYVWLIKRPDTGVVDVLFSTSASSPTMPTNYTLKRRIGAIIRSGAAILAFIQKGDRFMLTTPVWQGATIGNSRSLLTMTAPGSVTCLLRAYAFQAVSTVEVVLQPTYETDASPVLGASPLTSLRAEVANQGNAGEFEIDLDSSSQLAARASVASTALRLATLGWRDSRGRLGP